MTPRRRCRWRAARSRRARSSSRCRAAGSSRALARETGALHVACPGGYMPRAAIGALVAPLCTVLFRLGLAPGAHAQLQMAQAQLAHRRDACRPEVEGAANPARELARRIGRTIPMFYGGGALGGGRGVPVEVRRQREREGARVLERLPGARPQRDLRVGPARRRDPPADDAGGAAPRLRARPAAGAVRRPGARSSTSACTRCCRSTPRARAGSRSCSTSCTWATGRARYLALQNDVDPGPIDAISGAEVAARSGVRLESARSRRSRKTSGRE